MVDQWLAKQFFSRISPGTKVILVGDADQIPSVGAGNVFQSLIESKVIAVTVLDQIFRQAEDSRIAHNAQYIHKARTSLLYGDDFVFLKGHDQSDTAQIICTLYYKAVQEYAAILRHKADERNTLLAKRVQLYYKAFSKKSGLDTARELKEAV